MLDNNNNIYLDNKFRTPYNLSPAMWFVPREDVAKRTRRDAEFGIKHKANRADNNYYYARTHNIILLLLYKIKRRATWHNIRTTVFLEFK